MQNLISKLLEDNSQSLDKIFSDSPDVKRQKLLLKDGTPALLVYVEGMVNTDILHIEIIPRLNQLDSNDIFDETQYTVNLPLANSVITDNFEIAVKNVLSGWPAIFINGYDKTLSINLIKLEKREIAAPVMEKNVKGAQEAFVETLSTNMAILRRRIKNNRLKFKILNVGETTNQSLAIAYIDGLAKPEVLDAMYKKLKNIDYDGIHAIAYIEQLIADNQLTPFPHYLASERPDRAVSFLLEGRIVILLEGTPYILAAPMSFFSFLQAPDDYYGSWLVHSLNRLLRILALLIAVFLPASYIAMVSYHYYMIPLNLLIPLAESRARVPFPPVIEVLILETTLEMLREAAIRLPTFIGTAIGVVGGLIIGQAAVDAGVVSNIIIIVVAITAIASFIIPNYDMALGVRYTRFIVMFFASIFGIIGVVICGVFLLAHLVVMESMGEPYFKPMFPFNRNEFKDILLRPSLNKLKKRPNTADPSDKIRGKDDEQ